MNDFQPSLRHINKMVRPEIESVVIKKEQMTSEKVADYRVAKRKEQLRNW